MNVLTFNCGSSTLRFDLLEIGHDRSAAFPLRRIARGIIERIGGRAHARFSVSDGEGLEETAGVADHGGAAQWVLEWLDARKLPGGTGLAAVGHRVVHGGDSFVEPVLVDDDVVAGIEAVSDLAPLHNEPALEAIRAARSRLGQAVPMVAVFDTAFHRTLPRHASMYAIPHQLAAKHRIRRYGFHGLAHRYMVERYADIASTSVDRIRLITLQLGNGCSATAVGGGRSMDTSMGFTPLEGLMMGTRSGDIDASLVGFLARSEGVGADEVEDWLNSMSGLKGVSGLSNDMRELLEAEGRGDAQASLAVDMFCYRVRKYAGSYMAVLGGADAVVFGGGIGENSPEVRSRICAGMEWCGLRLDEQRNAETIGREGRISSDDAGVHVYVIPVDEAVIIALDTVQCLRRHREG